MSSCPGCGAVDSIEVDSAMGTSACSSCGLLLSENQIVSEVGFVEGSNGVSSVVGQFVPSSGPRSLSSTGRGVPMGHTRESRENTILNAKRRISSLASILTGVNSGIVEAAVKYFNMALTHNFVQGRRSANVSAACLYVACRRARTAHMLMDFSDALSVNVFVLGATVLKFLRTVSIKLPFTDPSLYMSRFANNLPFGQHAHAVANTALRLLAHMKRDWLQIGRRPSGICGACLFLAARMHNFQCSLQEVAQTVRIGELTIQRRLSEVSNTSTAALAAEELDALALEGDLSKLVAEGDQADPPAFQRLQLQEEKKRRLRALLRDKPDLPALLGLAADGEDADDVADVSLEGILRQMNRSLRSSPVLGELYDELRRAAADGATADISADLDFLPGDDAEEKADEDGIEEAEEAEGTDAEKKAKAAPLAPLSRAERVKLRLGAQLDGEVLETLDEQVASLALPASVGRQAQLIAQGRAEGDVDSLLTDATRNPVLVAAALAGSAESRFEELDAQRQRMIERVVKEIELFQEELKHDGFSDLDEDDLDTWLLDAEARDQKTRLWEAMHREYLIDEENRRKLGGVTRRPKERKIVRKVTGARGERKVSDKVNYEAMQLIQGLDTELDVRVGGVAPEDDLEALLQTIAAPTKEERRVKQSQSQIEGLLQRPIKASQEVLQPTAQAAARLKPTKTESSIATKAERDGPVKPVSKAEPGPTPTTTSSSSSSSSSSSAASGSLDSLLDELERESRVKQDARSAQSAQASALLGLGKRGSSAKGPVPKKPKM